MENLYLPVINDSSVVGRGLVRIMLQFAVKQMFVHTFGSGLTRTTERTWTAVFVLVHTHFFTSFQINAALKPCQGTEITRLRLRRKAIRTGLFTSVDAENIKSHRESSSNVSALAPFISEKRGFLNFLHQSSQCDKGLKGCHSAQTWWQGLNLHTHKYLVYYLA